MAIIGFGVCGIFLLVIEFAELIVEVTGIGTVEFRRKQLTDSLLQYR